MCVFGCTGLHTIQEGETIVLEYDLGHHTVPNGLQSTPPVATTGDNMAGSHAPTVPGQSPGQSPSQSPGRDQGDFAGDRSA